MAEQYDTETQAVLDVFEEAGLEVTPAHDTDAVPRDSQALVACQYKGKHRISHSEACRWHQDHADAACKGCERCLACVPEKKPSDQKQFSLFRG
jgi:hypothetical protein